MTDQTRPLPSSICSGCGKPGYETQPGERCQCGGEFNVASDPGDWRECASCRGAGRLEDHPCAKCHGSGWVYSPKS